MERHLWSLHFNSLGIKKLELFFYEGNPFQFFFREKLIQQNMRSLHWQKRHQRQVLFQLSRKKCQRCYKRLCSGCFSCDKRTPTWLIILTVFRDPVLDIAQAGIDATSLNSAENCAAFEKDFSTFFYIVCFSFPFFDSVKMVRIFFLEIFISQIHTKIKGWNCNNFKRGLGTFLGPHPINLLVFFSGCLVSGNLT